MALVQAGKLFSCGNHAMETTKGMLHFGDPSQVVCIPAVPSTMTVRDIIQFLSPSIETIENTRILREVNHDSTSYIVLLSFRDQESAKLFYHNFDGLPFNSIEDNACKLLYVTRMETFSEDPAKQEETSNCAVCLDGINAETESIITILCNHSFHAHCLSKWSDTSCPVCRYCQTPESQVENKCMICSYEGESLWMCIICGYVACGRYISGHAYDHFRETQHTYAMQLTDNQVWDYAGDNYVHRLLANKTDGKPVEVESQDAYRQAEEKIEAVQLEYTYLLTQQLESQRKLLEDTKRQYQREIRDVEAKLKKSDDELQDLTKKQSQAQRDKAVLEKKLQSTKSKLARSRTDLSDEMQMNKCLTLNQEQFAQKLKQLEQDVEKKDARIKELEEQLRDLMFFIEGRDKINALDENEISLSELNSSHIVIPQSPSTSSQQSKSRNNRRRRK